MYRVHEYRLDRRSPIWITGSTTLSSINWFLIPKIGIRQWWTSTDNPCPTRLCYIKITSTQGDIMKTSSMSGLTLLNRGIWVLQWCRHSRCWWSSWTWSNLRMCFDRCRQKFQSITVSCIRTKCNDLGPKTLLSCSFTFYPSPSIDLLFSGCWYW